MLLHLTRCFVEQTDDLSYVLLCTYRTGCEVVGLGYELTIARRLISLPSAINSLLTVYGVHNTISIDIQMGDPA
jgi:hypothetical protein